METETTSAVRGPVSTPYTTGTRTGSTATSTPSSPAVSVSRPVPSTTSTRGRGTAGRGGDAARAPRQPEMVVPLPPPDPRPLGRAPLCRARLPRVRPLGRSAGVLLPAGGPRGGRRGVRRRTRPDGPHAPRSRLGQPDRPLLRARPPRERPGADRLQQLVLADRGRPYGPPVQSPARRARRTPPRRALRRVRSLRESRTRS